MKKKNKGNTTNRKKNQAKVTYEQACKHLANKDFEYAYEYLKKHRMLDKKYALKLHWGSKHTLSDLYVMCRMYADPVTCVNSILFGRYVIDKPRLFPEDRPYAHKYRSGRKYAGPKLY